MKRTLVISLIFVSITSLFFTPIPNVLSQPENVQVLSYSWYISSKGTFIVVGEVQNVGSTILDLISLGGRVHTKDGEPQATAYTTAYSAHILPQQKAPFIFYFYPGNSYTGDFSWLSIGVDHVEFAFSPSETENYQYPDLEITESTHYINLEGFYTVTGSIRNTGDQAAGKLWVVATFYNSTGSVIAIGFSKFLTPDSLQPGQTTSFTLTTVDSIPELANEITDYALLIQTEGPIIPEFPSWIILPLFLVITLFGIIFRKKLRRL